MKNGANACTSINNLNSGPAVKSVFSHFLKLVPNECQTILTSFMEKNNLSLAAHDLEVKIDFQIWEAECCQIEMDGLLRL